MRDDLAKEALDNLTDAKEQSLRTAVDLLASVLVERLQMTARFYAGLGLEAPFAAPDLVVTCTPGFQLQAPP